MKKILLLAGSLAAFLPALAQEPIRTCHTMDYLEEQKQLDPGLELRMQSIERFTQDYVQSHAQASIRQLVTIPVVVHVVYNTAAENISDAQILSQIEVLNEDFRRTNSDANGLWAQAADTDIEFCLATLDPSGNPTNGITRTSTTRTSFSSNNTVKYSNQGGKDAWPRDSYLNIWVCDLGSGLLGYAQFPGGAAATDGVVCDYAYFGTIGTATAPFNLGRTATHEVGHWLNLRHIWGDDGTSCTQGSDFVGDTPNQADETYGCPSGARVSCSNGPAGDMYQNYMDYTDDACMNLFTAGQRDRMQAVLAPGGARAALLSSGACGGGGTAPTCSDGVQNGQETGVDCGGPSCPACPVAACEAPANLSASGITRRQATLSWSAANGASSYTLFIRRQGTTTWTSFNTSNLSLTISGLSRNRTYEYYVQSNCAGGQTASSPIQTFATAARYAGEIPALSAYPSPASDVLTVEFGDLEGERVALLMTDLAGRVVLRLDAVSTLDGYTELNVSQLKQGVYFLTLLDSDGERYTEKIMISR